MKRIAKRIKSFSIERFEFSVYNCPQGLLNNIYTIKFIKTINRNLKKQTEYIMVNMSNSRRCEIRNVNI